MYYVYVIQSKKNGEIYIGSTNDLRRRIHEHDHEVSVSTKRYAPWRLVYYEAYRSEIDAREREKMLKQHGQSIGHLKRRIRFSLKDFETSEKKGLSSTFRKSAGFTLVEVLVTLFIIVLMSGIIFANYRQVGQQFVLQRSANKLAQDIRRAQQMAMGAREFNGMIPQGGYGVYLDLNAPFNTSYVLFADCDGNFHYDNPDCGLVSCAADCSSATPANPYPEKVEKIDFEKGVTVCKFCTGGADKLHIVYTPPDPKVTITEVIGGGENQAGYMEIVLTNGDRYKTINVNTAGLIWIKD